MGTWQCPKCSRSPSVPQSPFCWDPLCQAGGAPCMFCFIFADALGSPKIETVLTHGHGLTGDVDQLTFTPPKDKSGKWALRKKSPVPVYSSTARRFAKCLKNSSPAHLGSEAGATHARLGAGVRISSSNKVPNRSWGSFVLSHVTFLNGLGTTARDTQRNANQRQHLDTPRNKRR